MNNLKKKSHIFVIVYRILFIYRVKIVTMIVFYLCIKHNELNRQLVVLLQSPDFAANQKPLRKF